MILFKRKTLNLLHCKILLKECLYFLYLQKYLFWGLSFIFLRKKDIDSDPKIPTALRITTDRLFSKKVPSLKLYTTFPACYSLNPRLLNMSHIGSDILSIIIANIDFWTQNNILLSHYVTWSHVQYPINMLLTYSRHVIDF